MRKPRTNEDTSNVQKMGSVAQPQHAITNDKKPSIATVANRNKDYWNNPIHKGCNHINNSKSTSTSEPDFIKLFIINRIVGRYIKNQIYNDYPSLENTNRDTIINTNAMIALLVDEFFPKRNKNNVLAFQILFRLINFGIKNYVSKFYNENEQNSTIDTIFTQMILRKFEKEYHELITFDGNNAVFNTSDLMCKIFQYLTNKYQCENFNHNQKYGLVACSLVSSHWLYHGYNPNSLYFVNLGHIIGKTLKYKRDDCDKLLRSWQRLINVKSISNSCFCFSDHEIISNHLLLQKLPSLRNVSKIEIHSHPVLEQCSMVRPVMQQCKNKIESFEACWCDLISSKDQPSENILPPLKLENVKKIKIEKALYFYIIWSYKCEQLTLEWVKNISDQWFNFVIENCDCSGIKRLWFHNIRCLSSKSNNDYYSDNQEMYTIHLSPSKELMLKKFALKFSNLEKLIINFSYNLSNVDSCVLLIWKFLLPIIKKNNVQVELSTFELGKGYHLLNEIIEKEKLQIHTLRAPILHNTGWIFENILELVCNPTLECLSLTMPEFDTDTSDTNALLSFLSVMYNYISNEFQNGTDVPLKSLKVIKVYSYDNCHFTHLVKVLETLIRINTYKRVFIAVNCDVWTLSSNAAKTFENVLSILNKQQLSIDITIEFCIEFTDGMDMKTVWDQCTAVYLSFFNNLNPLQDTKCDFSVPLKENQTSFVLSCSEWHSGYPKFRMVNARLK